MILSGQLLHCQTNNLQMVFLASHEVAIQEYDALFFATSICKAGDHVTQAQCVSFQNNNDVESNKISDYADCCFSLQASWLRQTF